MIPKVDNDLLTLEVETQPSLTYALDIEHGRIRGMVDELESLRQAIYLILSTERYAYLIYSWNYGVELVELIGQPKEYALPEIKRCITEYLSNGSGSASWWWERSPYGSASNGFCYVGSNGNAGGNFASSTNGVCFGFCV